MQHRGCGMPCSRSTCAVHLPIGLTPEKILMSSQAMTAKPPSPAGAKPLDGLPPEQRRWAVAAIFTALAMGSLDTVIANIALPAMAADLHVSPAEIVWVVNAYQIIIVATVLPLGALGEIVGPSVKAVATTMELWPNPRPWIRLG